MSATVGEDLPSLALVTDPPRAGTSRMISRLVSPVLMTPVPISVPPMASTIRPPAIPEIKFDAAVARLGPGCERRGGVGVRTGISAGVRGGATSTRRNAQPDCRASRGATVRAVLHRPLRRAPGEAACALPARAVAGPQPRTGGVST